ncbi:hypothetical protein Aglo01_35220 [Actinokineospora globicatena]|nr:hypothetical protein Aglo01_35220 [Actinokineospora globicatena]
MLEHTPSGHAATALAEAVGRALSDTPRAMATTKATFMITDLKGSSCLRESAGPQPGRAATHAATR